MKKLLIVYYSWSNGNTKKIAKELQKVTGGDLARIDTKTAYKDQDYQVVDQAEKDVQRGYEPVLAPRFFKVKDYDAIALGMPTWWYTMAPAMKTFLHEEKMEGKLVIPFATHGGWPSPCAGRSEEGLSRSPVRTGAGCTVRFPGRQYPGDASEAGGSLAGAGENLSGIRNSS
ncbi:flavodoxin [Acidaminococcus fermentans]|uniref:flavodoxin n=1 Tax=Acidaminococcus fermentans TaxID=905 RepID=UPI002E79605A|nr:flavodoxin [Acidaminococcus fermentans]MEE0338466.1 flavodoxin [Acidaminococcus fermentans]